MQHAFAPCLADAALCLCAAVSSGFLPFLYLVWRFLSGLEQRKSSDSKKRKKDREEKRAKKRKHKDKDKSKDSGPVQLSKVRNPPL